MASTNLNLMQSKCANFCDIARRLYGADVDLDKAADRFVGLGRLHEATFDTTSYAYFSSPGRIELLGNHTDHQHGEVLCASINLDTLAAVTPRKDGRILIKSGNYPLIDVRLTDTEYNPAEQGTSLALVKGVVTYFRAHGYKVGGFSATMTSNVARGSGVSSSASFECCVAETLNVLFNEGAVSPIEKAKASQWAERDFFGKPCGLLDQSAIALGGVSYIDFKDPAKPLVRKVEYPFDSQVILVNSGGDHTRLTDCYAAIKEEMQAVASVLGGKVLRDVEYTPDLFAKCREAGLSGRAVLRALHFFREETRVEEAIAAIDNRDQAAFYQAVNQSGLSSAYYLQNTCVPGDSAQPINYAVEYLRALGARAARVHGGGFAGTVLGIFDTASFDAAYRTIVDLYGEDNVFAIEIRPDGAIYTGVES